MLNSYKSAIKKTAIKYVSSDLILVDYTTERTPVF